MKLATALIEADEPSIARLVPFLVIVVNQRFSVLDTVFATMSSKSCPPVRSRCNCSMVATLCWRTCFCLSNDFDLLLDVFEVGLLRLQHFNPAVLRIQLSLP